jgi:L-ascorbate metabolism protein UlaG (beta-lactamase superfamily)
MTHNIHITYIGGPTALIEAGGLRILTDPTFDPPGKEYEIPRTGLNIRKLHGPGLSIEQVADVDIVLLSHDEHADNLDSAGRQLLVRARHVLTTASGASRLGVSTAIGLKPFESRTLDGLRLTATPGRHGPEGCEPVLGDVTGFLVEATSGQFDTFYISGDTVYYPALDEIGNRFRVPVAILNLGRVGGPGEPHYTMGADEAAALARSLGATRVVPLHYEDWAHFSEDRAHAERVFADAGMAPSVTWLQRGVRTAL